MNHRGKTQAARRGASTLEAAIVFPLVILLTMALLEYGWMFLKAQQITNAARQGARVGARADSTAADVVIAVDAAMTQAGMSGSGYSVDIAPSNIIDLEAAELLTVTVSVVYAGNVELLELPLIPVPDDLDSSITMAREGP